MNNFFYYVQQNGGEEAWKAIPAASREETELNKPVFITVLAVSKLVEDLSYEDKLKLAYMGPFYCDWDSSDEELVIEKVNQFLDKLEAMRVDLRQCRLYATGGRGYHLEIPPEIFISKVPRTGVIGLPSIYREMAYELAVDTLDLKIYSGGKGRMWRVPGVKRTNNRYKVPITAAQMREMTPELCAALTSMPRDAITPLPPAFCADLSIVYSRAQQKVDDLMKKRARFKPDPRAAEKAGGLSVEMAMAGLGWKKGTGFQEIAIQLAIAASTSQLGEDAFITACEGLIDSHESDSDRYNTAVKRTRELRRMHNYMYGNFAYEFSIGALKTLLSHPAPDLDGLKLTETELKEVIVEAEAEDDVEQDEYDDVARGMSLQRFGIYKTTEFGLKRICAVSFINSAVLKSAENCQIIGYETDVMVNGVMAGRQTLEVEVFSGLVPFNRFAARYGHAFQGTDVEVRTVMMRFVEQAKKKGTIMYVMKREGLDVVSIPHHENPLYHTPFLVWADANGVITGPSVADTGLELTFAGYPDPRGVFKTDIAKAPPLVDFLAVPGNRELMVETLENLMTCQKPELLGKMLGWYISCFWKQIFQKVYGKFPLLHVNGSAGVGKTEMNILLNAFFYHEQEPQPSSPSSTGFAMQTKLTASSSIPLILDEYKPHEMGLDLRNKLKLLFRDAYNQRPVSRGGGTRESDDYRSLHETQLAAPMVFIAEAAEDEAAVMERVVLATFGRPPAVTGLRWLARFQFVRRNHKLLGTLGQYLAAQIVSTTTLDSFRDEFEAIYDVAKTRYMLNEADLKGDLPEEELRNKQNAKERSVYNYTVAKFGFIQFRRLINSAVGDQLDDLMGELEGSIYDRLADLQAATTPEHIKVLGEFASMSHHIAADQPTAIRLGHEYAFHTYGSRDCIEIALKPAYLKYRSHMRSASMQALYSNPESFMYGVKESPAFVKFGTGESLGMPGVYVFDVAELAKFGVDLFKSK